MKRHRWCTPGPSALLVAAAMLAGCTANVSTHGHSIDPADLERIQPGITSREEVTRILGSPSTIGTFERERWFYISQRNEVMSFYKADITAQDVVRIDFDASGIVTDVRTHGLEMAQAIEPDPNETRTLGNELGAIQQILGNIGRFNTSPETRPTGTPPGGN